MAKGHRHHFAQTTQCCKIAPVKPQAAGFEKVLALGVDEERRLVVELDALGLHVPNQESVNQSMKAKKRISYNTQDMFPDHP